MHMCVTSLTYVCCECVYHYNVHVTLHFARVHVVVLCIGT